MTAQLETPQYVVGNVHRFRSYDVDESVGITKDGVVWDLSGLSAPTEYVKFVLVDPDNNVNEFDATPETAVLLGSDGIFYFDTVEDGAASAGGLDQTGTWQTWWVARKGGVKLKFLAASIEVVAPGEQGL